MSGVEDFKWMIRYLDSLDDINAKILEGLGTYGPRNISALAKELKLSPTTVAFRISKLVKESGLQTRARLSYQKLGLSRAVVFAEAKPGKEKTLQKLVENSLYWTYMARCFGKVNGIYALFSFPAEFKNEFENYFKEATKQKILDDYLLFWVTDFCEKPPNFTWFNFKKRSWTFQWQRWMDEIKQASETFPSRLRDPETYPIMVDNVDLLILKELEKDGTIEFKQLAKVVKMTPEAVRYRFQNHILKRGLIANYEISIFPYPHQSSELSSFVIDFKSKEALAKFVNSLANKPFVLNYSKAIGQNKLISHFYIPKIEFPNLVDALNTLIEAQYITRYLYVLLDISFYKRQTVSYEFFEKNKWTYNNITPVKN